MFSPSVPITKFCLKRFKRAIDFLEKQRFKVLCGNLIGKSDFYRSGSIKERADELNELIRNPKVRCIMSTIGGMNSNSILSYIDYEALKKDPKIIIGYFDVTAILLGIYSKTDITTYYGPAAVASFGEFELLVSETFAYFYDICCDENIKYPYEMKAPTMWTDEFIDWESQEREKELKPNNSLLKLSGIFDKIGGIILGKHELFDDKRTKRKPYEVLLEVLGDIRKPFLAEFDCCHTHPMITMPIGSIIELDATNKSVKILVTTE
ncbi:MAG: S66 family peptidase [Sarcina sp.]